MADSYYHEGQGMQQSGVQRSYSYQVAKAATAATAGGSLLVLSGLTLAGTVISLIVATPLLMIFSPVLVPAVITLFVLASGFLTSGGFGVAAATVLSWMYKYASGGHPKVEEIRERGEHAGGGGH